MRHRASLSLSLSLFPSLSHARARTHTHTHVGEAQPPLLRLERGAMIHFGVPSYGIHVNGYVANSETHRPEFIWVAKRSMSKATYPGMFDQVSISLFCFLSSKSQTPPPTHIRRHTPRLFLPHTHASSSSLPHTHKSEFTHACVRVRVCVRWRGWVR